MVIEIAPPALLLATSTTDQLVRSLFDDTFNGVHHLAFFDWALLVPYFAILIVLSFYGPALGFLVVLAFLGVAGWLISRGFGVEGTVLGSVDIASLAAVFALGRQKIEQQPSVNDTTLGAAPNNAELDAV